MSGQAFDKSKPLSASTAQLFITTNWAFRMPGNAGKKLPHKSWVNNPHAAGRGWNFVQVRCPALAPEMCDASVLTNLRVADSLRNQRRLPLPRQSLATR